MKFQEHRVRRKARQRMMEVGRKKMTHVRSRGIFLLPNLFTTASLFCAFLAIVKAMDGAFAFASLMILLSMVFDGMDGRVARLTHTQSAFGEQFDSIADMTAFGVAPALVMYKFALFDLGQLGWAAAFIYCLCAGVRLARFNCNIGVVDKRFFQGLPSPAAAALLAGFVWLAMTDKLPEIVVYYLPQIAFVLTVYAGLTMVSNAPFWSGKSAACLRTAPFWAMVLGALLFIVISSRPSLSLFVLFCFYAVSGYIYQFWLFMMDRPNPVLPPELIEETQPKSETKDKTDEQTQSSDVPENKASS